MKNCFRIIPYALLFLFLSNCKSPKGIINATPFDLDCPQVIYYDTFKTDPIDSIDFDPILMSNYSYSSLIVANAYGIRSLLLELENLRLIEGNKFENDSIKIAILQKEKEINKILDMAFIELESYESFIECNILNLVRIHALLSDENTKYKSKYTNGAIIFGLGSAAIIGTILITDNEELKEGDILDWIGIGSAAVSAYLAFYSERIDKRVSLIFQKNLIYPIWTGNHSQHIFSDRYWYLLNQDNFSISQGQSIRELIKTRWEQAYELLGSEKNRSHLPTLLAKEGSYTEELLLLRIDLLEEIKVGIDNLTRSLYILNFEID